MQKINSKLASSHFQKFFGVTATSLALLGLTVVPAVLATSTVQAAPEDKVEARLYVLKSTIKSGETIPVMLRAINPTNKKVTLNFSSGQRYDFKVYRQGENNPIYTWGATKLFIVQPGTIEIKGKSNQQFSAELGVGDLQPGKYRLEGIVTANPALISEPIRFEIAGSMTGNPAQPNLNLVAKTDKKNYAVGEAVKIDFALSNPSSVPATLNFKSGQQYEINIRNENDKLVWNWSANKKFIMAALPMTLPAGNTKTYSETWNQQVLEPAKLKPGKYTINVIFESQPRIKAKPITIRIN